MKPKIPFGYTKQGTVRFYNLMCWLGVFGYTRPIRFKMIKNNKETVFNHFRELFLGDMRSVSYRHLIRHGACYFGFHRPYPKGSNYSSCWVCGQDISK